MTTAGRGFRPGLRRVLQASLLAALLAASVQALGAELPQSPDAVLPDFYRALQQGECGRAVALRPDYTRGRCSNIATAALQRSELICQGPMSAAYKVRIDYSLKTSPGHLRSFEGYAAVELASDGWRIARNSYYSLDKLDLEAYLRTVAGLDPDCAGGSLSSLGVSLEPRPAPVPDPAKEPAPEPEPAPPAEESAISQRPAVPATPAPPVVEMRPAPAPVPETKPEPKPTPEAKPEPAPEPESEPAPRAAPTASSSTPHYDVVRLPTSGGEYYLPPPVYGSQAVLDALFTPDQLTGISSEVKSTALPEPDRIPPPRLVPQHVLAPVALGYRGSIRRISPPGGEKPLALTFDLCEAASEVAGYDVAVVDYLRENYVRATFFAGGKWMRSHEERAMQLMADPLFEVGSHGWTHGNLRRIKGRRMLNQILWPQAQYELIWEKLVAMARKQGVADEELARIPAVPLTFRFPYGVCGPHSLDALAEAGLPAIQWDMVSGDPDANISAVAMAAAIRGGVKPGSIIICHANGRGVNTADALPLFVSQLRDQGYEFVTVSELLRMGSPVSAKECYETRPGDNAQYDSLSGD